MPRRSKRGPALTFRPLGPDRFADLERLFGPRGACGGCWCMWFRVPAAAYRAGRGERNRLALRAYVEAGHVPGLLAYDGDMPVGWVAVEPRAAYPRLAHSRVLAPVDDAPAWSITCFFVARSHRGRGLTRALVEAAAAHARACGARLAEGYPVEPRRRTSDAFLYHGPASAFAGAGFREVARRSPTRPIFRRSLRPRQRRARRAT